MRIVSRPNYILCLSVSIIRCIMYRFVHDSPAFRSPCHSSSLFADGRPPRWAARPAPPWALHVRGGPPAMVCLLSHSMVLLSGGAVQVPCLRTWTVARLCNNRATVPNQQPQATAQPPPPPMSPLSWDCSPSPIPPHTPTGPTAGHCHGVAPTTPSPMARGSGQASLYLTRRRVHIPGAEICTPPVCPPANICSRCFRPHFPGGD